MRKMITYLCSNMETLNFQARVEPQDFRHDRGNLCQLLRIREKELMRCKRLKERNKINCKRKLC